MSDAVEYFDLGAWESWNFMDWQKGEVNKQGLDNYLNSLASQLIAQNLTCLTLSFAQVCDISNLALNNFTNLSKGDAIGSLYINIGGKTIDGQSVFSYIIETLSSYQIKVGLAFGGIAASDSDWNFNFYSQQNLKSTCSCTNKSNQINYVRMGIDPASLANTLAAWAKSLKIAYLDFDIESAAIAKNDPKSLVTFFSTLHSQIETTLTIMADSITYGLQGQIFGPMFSLAKIQTLFDGINLMAYNGQYYLNAGQLPTQSWDLFLWLDQVEKNSGLDAEGAGKYINIGFNARVDYTSPASCGGPLPYTKMPSGISNGSAARFILEQLYVNLKAQNPNITMGIPFFWDSNASYTVTAANNFACTFFANTNNFEKDFLS
jgi:hypothetical protein